MAEGSVGLFIALGGAMAVALVMWALALAHTPRPPPLQAVPAGAGASGNSAARPVIWLGRT
jgi:hypothetical protein